MLALTDIVVSRRFRPQADVDKAVMVLNKGWETCQRTKN
jgi:hypothetical protein